MSKKYRPETEGIRTQAETTSAKEHSVPMYLTSSFVFDDAEEMRASFAGEKKRNIYSRFSNPNAQEFVDKMVKLEGAEAGFPMATGMASIFSTFGALCNAGDHIISARAIFGSTHSVFTKILPKFGIETSYA
ncbi:MAG: O-succinylhomoserine sulfhydrylase, partial [Thalassobium sp.]